MKKILLPIMTILLTSCTVKNYYQVYKASVDNGVIDKNRIVFEDSNCVVTYNLWKAGGDVGFSIYNKTARNMTVYLNKSFFVVNGVAYEYFQNRVFSNASKGGNTRFSNGVPQPGNAWVRANDYNTSYIEKPERSIPPKTSVNISEYLVTNARYIDCDLVKFPSSKEIKTVAYNKDNSPFVFYNLITYATKSDTVKIENKFYVSSITNYPSTEMFTSIDTSVCGRKLDNPIQVFKNLGSDRFFVKYKMER